VWRLFIVVADRHRNVRGGIGERIIWRAFD
jgi:hypothetical protein